MAPKKLTLVTPDPVGTPAPPRALGKAGQALWRSVLAEYDVSDAAGAEMLCQACAALDRAEALREAIDADGEVIRSKGTLRDHPGLKHELASRAFVVRTLHRLGLDCEPVRAMGRPPTLA